MKTIIRFLFLSALATNAFAISSIEMEQINLSGNLHRRQVENKIESRRRKLEEQTMKNLLRKMEVERIKNELRLSKKFENALEQSVSNLGVE